MPVPRSLCISLIVVRCRLLLLLALLAACEHPTAPQTRSNVETAEAKMVSGDYMQLQSGISSLFEQASYYAAPAGGGRYVPSDWTPVIRNGLHEAYRTTLVERVYVPPRGTGALTYSRFSVLAWTPADERGVARKLVVMFAGDSLSHVTPPAKASIAGFADTRGKPGYVLTADAADRRAWYGTDGDILIRTGPRTDDCPYDGMKRHASAIVELQMDSTGGLLCETRRYDVRMAAFIERGDPARRDIVSRIRPIRETLRMSESTIPGVRIVTRCTAKLDLTATGCFDYWSFWRSSAQFDSTLGVDLDRMRYDGSQLVQVVDSGTGPDYREVRGGYDVPLSYVIHSYEGRVLRSVQRTTPQTEDDRSIGYIAGALPQRVGARYRIIRTGLIGGQSPFDMQVLDLTFLSHSQF